tara:strand:+ start:1551 stop:2153 length:603 start_codon:yes stop_codon:yes gene_type:complete
MNKVLISSYFPKISYFKNFYSSEIVFIEIHESFQRHSERNRTKILSANGSILLTVPVKKNTKYVMKNVEVADEIWKKKHLMSIKSAYGSAPYFIYYFDDIKKIIEKKHKFLIDLNNEVLSFFKDILNIKTEFRNTDKYVKSYSKKFGDYRNEKINYNFSDYPQVFGNKFKSNLSILDLIFNLGPESEGYIKNLSQIKQKQ